MAAEVTTKLVVHSSEYESKLKRATASLQQMEKDVRRTGATFAYADKEELAFIESLGQMGTQADNARGQIAEMTAAFEQLSMMYKRMTDEERKSPFGKMLGQSLDQLKGRINTTKTDLGDVTKQLGGGNGLGGVLQSLGSKMGIPVGAFTALGAATAAAAAAAKVAKDAFLATESGIDTWGQTVEGAKASYSVFLQTLNNGNWSNFFTNIKNAISGAKELYNAMDRLASIKANNAAAIAKEQATIQELRLRQQKGENVAAELREAEERLRKLQNESVDQGKTAGREQMKQTLTNSVNSIKGTGGIFRKDMTAKVAEADIDAAIEDILAHGQQAMDKYAEQYSQLTAKATKTVTETRYSQGGQAYQVSTSNFDINALTAEEQALYKLSKAVTDSESALSQGISTYAQALQEGASSNREASRTEGMANRSDRAVQVPVEPVLPEGSAAALKKQISELQKAWDVAGSQEERDTIKGQIDAASEALKAMTPQIEQTASVIRDAAAMWSEHTSKIEDVKARLSEFQAMAEDSSLSEAQRAWAAGMAESYKTELDKMTGATEEVVDTITDKLSEIPSSFEMFKDGVGAVSTLVGSLDRLKGIGEDLASVFSGEMDAWDSLMTILESGIGILETVISVTEAINTLTELGTTLKMAHAAAATTEATTEATAAATEVAAEGEVAAASATTTGVKAGEAAAGAGSAMSAIPIVGPILAVAAIAAVLAAIMAATSKAKSAGKYASGGIVPGDSFSGDNLTANVNSGELILNRAQQNNLAAQMKEPGNGMQISGRLQGRDLVVSIQNYQRSVGVGAAFMLQG